jgi:hypothetical protein
MHSSIHTTLGSSPGSFVFSRDMFLNIPLIADWHAITQKHEHLINENQMRARLQLISEIRQRNFVPCPFCLCALSMAMLTTAHLAGAALMLCHRPCVLTSTREPEKSFESPYAVQRKNFISCMVFNIAPVASFDIPNKQKTSEAIA